MLRRFLGGAQATGTLPERHDLPPKFGRRCKAHSATCACAIADHPSATVYGRSEQCGYRSGQRLFEGPYLGVACRSLDPGIAGPHATTSVVHANPRVRRAAAERQRKRRDVIAPFATSIAATHRCGSASASPSNVSACSRQLGRRAMTPTLVRYSSSTLSPLASAVATWTAPVTQKLRKLERCGWRWKATASMIGIGRPHRPSR